jgi:competence protein ComEC
VLSYYLCGEREKEKVFQNLYQKGIYNVELIAAPIEKAKSYLCKVEVLQQFDTNSWQPTQGKAYLYLKKNEAASKLLFGDRLMVEAEFTPPERALNPDGFDYAAYLKKQGVGATCYIPADSWRLFGKNESFSFLRESNKCQNTLLNVYRKFKIDGDEFAVLAALTLGYTDDLNPDLRSSYSATGAMHILSVSGMHVGVVFAVIAFLLSFMNKNQRQKILKTIIITLFLWSYAFITGLSPAVIRATLMFTFIALATCFDRKSHIYNTIFMSILVMLLYNPNFLFDVGFQLSYSAVLSIIFFQPIIVNLYKPQNKVARFGWNVVAVSLAAQLGTTPFTLYYFQQFPNYFLLTNIVAIDLSSVIIYLAMALLMISYVPYLSVSIAFLLKWSLWLLNFLIILIQNLPFSVAHISLDFKQMFVAFIAILCLSSYYFTKKYYSLFIGMSALLIICIFNLQVKYNTLTSKRMIVYAGQKSTHINFLNSTHNFVYSSDSAEIEKIAKSFWQNQKLDKPQFIKQNCWFSDGNAFFEGSRIVVLKKELLKMITVSNPLQVDYLIIGDNLKPKINQVLENIQPRKIIVDKSVSKWYTESIRKKCIERNITFYSVAENGAYILNFIEK